MTEELLHIATFNLKDNGGARRAEALALLADLQLDALLMQELADDEAQLAETEQALGMRGAVAGGNRGKLHTGAFVRPATFPAFRSFQAEKLGRLRPTDVTTHLAERPNISVTLVSVHLSYNSPIDRMREAYALVPVADKAQSGQPVIVGGDWNELPVQDGEELGPVDWEAVSDRVHRGYRARRRSDGVWEPVTDVDAKLHEIGMHDAAKHIAVRDRKPTAAAATAGHARLDQGGQVRLDRILVPEWMLPAVVDADVVDTGLSDHRLVKISVARPRLIELLDAQAT